MCRPVQRAQGGAGAACKREQVNGDIEVPGTFSRCEVHNRAARMGTPRMHGVHLQRERLHGHGYGDRGLTVTVASGLTPWDDPGAPHATSHDGHFFGFAGVNAPAGAAMRSVAQCIP